MTTTIFEMAAKKIVADHLPRASNQTLRHEPMSHNYERQSD